MSMTLPQLALLPRVLHQLKVELRRDRGLLLMWLLLLGVYALEHVDTEKVALRGAFMPEALPMALGLLLAWRLVRADHPGSAETASLTRPLGRGVLWLAKCLCTVFGGLLPWCAVQALEYRGFGLLPLSWLGVGIAVLLPACVAVFATCWLASLRIPRGWVIALATLAGTSLSLPMIGRMAPSFSYLYLDPMLDTSEWLQNTDLLRCRVIVGMSGVALALLWGWWRAALGASLQWLVLLLMLVSSVAGMFWPWNWRALPAKSFSRELRLHIGPAPEAAHQSLWSTLHVSGLAKDEVAAVMAFAPVLAGEEKWPPEPLWSDFVYWDENGQKQSFWRWMKADHAERLSGLFPPQTSWVGAEDELRDGLAKIIAEAEKRLPRASKRPWRLRLAVHRLRKVHEQTLAEVLRGTFIASPTPGWRFDVVKKSMSESNLSLDTRLRQLWPLTVPNQSYQSLKVLGHQPVANLLITVNAPAIQQVICLHEPTHDWSYKKLFWHHEHDRPCQFYLPLPVIHQTLADLQIPAWLQDARLALWWPDELGTLDLALTVEQVQELIRLTPTGEKP